MLTLKIDHEYILQSVIAHACDANTWKANTGEFLQYKACLCY